MVGGLKKYADDQGCNLGVLNGMLHTLLGIYHYYNYTHDEDTKYFLILEFMPWKIVLQIIIKDTEYLQLLRCITYTIAQSR
jgi:hypothetical protein